MLQHIGAIRLSAQGACARHEILSAARSRCVGAATDAQFAGIDLRDGGNKERLRRSHLMHTLSAVKNTKKAPKKHQY